VCACACVCVRARAHMLPVIVFPYEIYREELQKWVYLGGVHRLASRY